MPHRSLPKHIRKHHRHSRQRLHPSDKSERWMQRPRSWRDHWVYYGMVFQQGSPKGKPSWHIRWSNGTNDEQSQKLKKNICRGSFLALRTETKKKTDSYFLIVFYLVPPTTFSKWNSHFLTHYIHIYYSHIRIKMTTFHSWASFWA